MPDAGDFDLNAIIGRVAQSSAGGWMDGGPVGFGRVVASGLGRPIAVAYGLRTNPLSDADFDLMIHARSDLEACIAEIRRLRGEL